MIQSDILVFLPTYNESENVGRIYEMIRQATPDSDILFVDDNSPDGTGQVIDELRQRDSRVHVIHRAGKIGVGSAHQDGIGWAYAHGYSVLVSMDSDFAHSPHHIPEFVAACREADVVVGTRFARNNSLQDWNPYRKLMTHLGHILTRTLLRMRFDATGAFRCYALDRIPEQVFERIPARDYAFFFQSLHILILNGFSVVEIPIVLPARVYGMSKMVFRDVIRGFWQLLGHAVNSRIHRRHFMVERPAAAGPAPKDYWNAYWAGKEGKRTANRAYDRVAKIYRKAFIRPAFNRMIAAHVPVGATLLHAGCGGGESDINVVPKYNIMAYDISSAAIARYKGLHGEGVRLVNGDLMNIALTDSCVDGVYNLGVMEHFQRDEIERLLDEFHRVLKPGGKIILFWPPKFGLSVYALKLIHFVLNDVLRRSVRFHPPEPSLLSSRDEAERLLESHGFEMVDFYFGPRDMFTQAAVIGQALK